MYTPQKDGFGSREASLKSHGIPGIKNLFYTQRTIRLKVSFISFQSKGRGLWSYPSRPLSCINHCHHHHKNPQALFFCILGHVDWSSGRVVSSSIRLKGRLMVNNSKIDGFKSLNLCRHLTPGTSECCSVVFVFRRIPGSSSIHTPRCMVC